MAAAADQASRSVLQSTKYDKQGFALGVDGQRFTAGGQLTPPDASGNWEYVGDVRANNLNGPAGSVAVMRQDWWVPKGATAPAQLGGASGFGSGQGASTPAPTPAAAAPAAPATAPSSMNRTVTINIPGRGSAAVRVASDADAECLTGLLQLLEDAGARAA